MRVGVLGGGLQGCCTAIALAERGVDVALLDRNQTLLSRAATGNEGKIHLGYMYAADPSMATARAMMMGALAFAPFLERHLGGPATWLKTSSAANYVIHRDSQHDAVAVSAYLAEAHRLIGEAARGREKAYFGRDLSAPLRSWRTEERDAVFNPEAVVAAFETPEMAVDPDQLAKRIRECIAAHDRIEVRLGRDVQRVERDKTGMLVTSRTTDGLGTERFDHVVNALWDGRLAIDATMGFRPSRSWLHRLKYGVTFTLPDNIGTPPSITVVSGPFGEVVSFPDRQIYLTWYPECLHSISKDTTPPDWPSSPDEPVRSRTIKGTVAALASIMPGLDPLNAASLPDIRVKGGVILAWGKTDIYDRGSELHRRYEIGITSTGNYHSVDPGKLTLAPYFAERCAERIAGAG